MANEVLIKSDTPIVWADVTDYAGDLGTRTHQIDLTSVAAGAARQGAKADLGATRAAVYAVTVAIEMAVAPTSGAIASIWWAASPSATAGTANPGGCSGADAAYNGTAGDSIADSILQLTLIGSLVMTSDATTVVQFQTFMFSPEHRYGSPVVYNEEATQAFVADADEMGIAFTPIIDEVQDAP
jgi:hypothetical protein